MISSRVLNVGTSQASDVSITTDAGTNRAQGTIMVRNFDGGTAAGSPTAVFELGSTGGTRRGDSAFIDDNVYAMTDRKGDSARSSHVQSGGTIVPINSNTVLASYQAAPLQGGKLPGGVTPCECAFLSWGWWSGDISYDNPGYRQGQRDRLNLATYVAGTLTNRGPAPQYGNRDLQRPCRGQRHQRQLAVRCGRHLYRTSGASRRRRGQVTIGNFDGATYSGTAALTAGTVQFTGPLTGAGRTGSVSGAFMSSPTNPDRRPGRQLQHQRTRLSGGRDVRRPEAVERAVVKICAIRRPRIGLRAKVNSARRCTIQALDTHMLGVHRRAMVGAVGIEPTTPPV